MKKNALRIEYGKYWNGVTRAGQKKGYEPIRIYAWDTETCEGVIFYSAVYDGKTMKTCYGERKDHLKFLLDCIDRESEEIPVIFAYNLQFDLGCLLNTTLKQVRKKHSKKIEEVFKVPLPQYEILMNVRIGKPCFGEFHPLEEKSEKKSILVRDAMAWFPERTSMNKASEMIGSPLRKEDKPHQLGKKIFPEEQMRVYMEQDVRVLHSICEKITDWHESHDVSISVTMSNLASKIFRKKFLEVNLKKSAKMMHPYIMQTYHGGKLYSKPGHYKNCRLVDVRSAYPHAMMELPKFCCGTWEFIHHIGSPWGVYKIAGDYTGCQWGLFCRPYCHETILDGCISDVWVTGLELHEALRTQHFSPRKILGYVWKEIPCDHTHSFQEYCKYFYQMREEAPNKAAQTFPKLAMNGLYGKFYQRNEDESGNKIIAGPIFEPMIATLITSHARVRMHQMEHDYNALHTATDSIITQHEVPEKLLGKKIGMLSEEVSGDVTIVRNKCYAFYDQQGKLKKYAHHGWQGTMESLLEQFNENPTGTYEFLKHGLYNWRTARRLGEQPGKEYTMKMQFYTSKKRKETS